MKEKREYNLDGLLESIINLRNNKVETSFSYEYDLNGNRTKVTEEDGARTTYKYDALGRIIEVEYPKEKIESILKAQDTKTISQIK